MERGYVRLWRKTLQSRIFKNEGLLKVWIWCLLKATHKQYWVSVKTGKSAVEVELNPGEFVFGRESAGKELNMSPSTVWKRMQKLKNTQNLNIDSNRQYSVVSIINWPTYQTEQIKSDSEGDRQGTGKEHKQEQYNKYKYEKKVPLPAGINLTDIFIKYAESKGITEGRMKDIFEAFTIHHRKKGSKFTDWYAAWQTWARNEIKFNPERYPQSKIKVMRDGTVL